MTTSPSQSLHISFQKTYSGDVGPRETRLILPSLPIAEALTLLAKFFEESSASTAGPFGCRVGVAVPETGSYQRQSEIGIVVGVGNSKRERREVRMLLLGVKVLS